MEDSWSDQSLAHLALALGQGLKTRGWTMAAAESCTGGWVAKTLTDLPGSSQWFDRGWVTYSNEAKTEMLGVPAALIGREGAVSEAVAVQMAMGACRAAEVDCAVAITGVAGPGGGTVEKPVGWVWFAWAIGQDSVETASHLFSGDREQIRRQSVHQALSGLLERLERPLSF